MDHFFPANPEMRPYTDTITMLLSQSNSIFTDDNDIKVYVSAREKYKELLKDIQNAKETVNLQYFIIRPDSIGREIVGLLTKKAKQGVEVKLLYDEYGSYSTRLSFFRPLMEAGGEVRRFFKSRFENAIRINYRNHRKIVVIDRQKSPITGGMNIGVEYMGLNKKITPWRDTHIKITGSAVYMLQSRFLLDWAFSGGSAVYLDSPETLRKFFPLQESAGNLGVQIVASGPDTASSDKTGEHIKYGYLKMINCAKNAPLHPDPLLHSRRAVSRGAASAVASGVDVRVNDPRRSGQKVRLSASPVLTPVSFSTGVGSTGTRASSIPKPSCGLRHHDQRHRQYRYPVAFFEFRGQRLCVRQKIREKNVRIS
jgi:cardiolipin synthase